MSSELMTNVPETEVEKDLPSELLTQIAATYPFLNEAEYNAYMEKAVKIEAEDPIQEIVALVNLLDNPHATFKKSSAKKFMSGEINPDTLPSSELLDNVLYLKIPSLNRISLEDIEKVYLPYEDISEGIIIDLRENGGGSEIPARRFAEKYFIKTGKHDAGTNIQLAPESGLRHVKVPADSKNETPYDKPIVILTSNRTFSSAERFIAIMKAGTDCVLIGTETRGGSANPVQTEISYNGVSYTLNIPTWRFFLEGEDKPLEETKIKPDILYEKEDIVNFAINYIKESTKFEK